MLQVYGPITNEVLFVILHLLINYILLNNLSHLFMCIICVQLMNAKIIVVGFIYTFWPSLSSTTSFLEQEFQSIHHLQMTSSDGFQHHFTIISKVICCDCCMKKNVAFTPISFAVLKCDDCLSVQLPFELPVQIPVQLLLEL